MKQRYVVDTHKFLTPFVVLALMAAYGRWDNPTAWLYLALHGTYGMIWLVKSQVFPDKRWEQPVGLPWAAGMFFTLALYWIAPWIIVALNVQAPTWYAAGCTALYSVGIFLHFASDMQKHTAMQLRPGLLITDGLWAWVRNPNYLGELLIYIGFGALAMHWAPFVVMLMVVGVIWVPNMLRKDRSLSRYPEFEAYRRRTKLILPFVL